MYENDQSEPIDYTFKYIIIGDASVGKSNIILRFIKGQFKDNYNVTIGLEIGFKNIKKGDKNYRIQLWDTAGQEQFRSISRGYYKNSVCCFVVYDITKRDSFNKVLSWIDECKLYGSKQITIILLGNKKDLESTRQITYEEGKNLAESNGMEFFETSAKTGENIENAFEKSIDIIVNNINNNIYNLEDDNCGIRVGLQLIGKKNIRPRKDTVNKKPKKKCCK